MAQWATKITGNTLTAVEWNLAADEIENAETAGSESPSAGSTDQLGKAITNISSNATYYTDSGAADAYVLSVISPNQAPTAYRNGMIIRWRTTNANTGASTVNVATLGIKNIKLQDGLADPSANDISIYKENIAVYDGTSFRLISDTAISSRIICSNGTDADHDIDLTAGNFNFDDNTGNAFLSAITKQIDASWSAGTNAGGLDTGSVGNSTWYYLFAIYNPSTGVTDALFSASPTSPTMPSGYTKKKLLGAVITDVSANIELFTQQGNLFNFKNPLLIFSSVAVIASPTTTTGILPVLPVSAKVSMNLNANTTGNVNLVVYGNLTTITEVTDCASVASNDGYPFVGHGEIYADDGNISYYNLATAAGVDSQSSRLLSFRINNL